MKDVLKGIAVVMVTLGLWAIACNVKAGTPQEFLDIWKNKEVVHNAFCSVNSKGEVIRFDKDAKSVRCIAVSDEPDVHYIAIVGANGQAERLIRINPTTFEQSVVWRRGTEV